MLNFEVRDSAFNMTGGLEMTPKEREIWGIINAHEFILSKILAQLCLCLSDEPGRLMQEFTDLLKRTCRSASITGDPPGEAETEDLWQSQKHLIASVERFCATAQRAIVTPGEILPVDSPTE